MSPQPLTGGHVQCGARCRPAFALGPLLLATGLLAGSSWAAPPSPTPPAPRLDRNRPLEYRTARGEVAVAHTVAQWQRRRASILAGMQEVMGPFPDRSKRVPLDVQVESETDCGEYVRRFLTYAAEPGGRVPAYLLIPKRAGAPGARLPGALCLHQTHPLGQKVVVGLGNSPHDEYGVELARRGYVCLAPAYPLLANYAPDLEALGYRSGTMKAIWDNVRGLDLLESLPFVRRGAFGAIGHSLGGHNAVFTAVFDQRLRVVVSSCGLDSFLDYMGGDLRGWTSARYMPRLRDYAAAEVPFDFQELIAALAPRPCLIAAPLGDTNFRWRSVDMIARAARPVYALHGAADRLRIEHPDCGHVFPPELRAQAYAWFDAALLPSRPPPPPRLEPRLKPTAEPARTPASRRPGPAVQ